MYSFAELAGIRIVDEPLYGHYLRVSGRDHPGRAEILNAMDSDGDAVMQSLLLQQDQSPDTRLFVKHMAHHLVSLKLDFLTRADNIFLIRDPRQMLPSLTVQLPDAGLVDTGLQRQWELYEELVAKGQRPAVLDSKQLLLDPAGVLRKLCSHLDLNFDASMLTWRPGTRKEDGVWAPHWYHAVHQSTGFSSYVEKTEFPERLLPLLQECEPWYERLYQHALRAEPEG
jgi:hypothetical protein